MPFGWEPAGIVPVGVVTTGGFFHGANCAMIWAGSIPLAPSRMNFATDGTPLRNRNSM